MMSVVRLLEEGRGSDNSYFLTCSSGEGLLCNVDNVVCAPVLK